MDILTAGMVPEPKHIEVKLETLLDSVDLAESIVMSVAGAAGFSDEDCHKIGMSVREAVINAYNYGNKGDRRLKVLLKVELVGDKLVVRVLDEGSGFDPSDVPDPLAEENLLRTSGRGLFLMRSFMDEFAVQRGPEGGAELVMSKRLPSQASRSANPSAPDREEE
jgi:serine/threonine-protein kinase RsbW